jgi:Mucin-2 protein WxxW repeating region
MLSKRSRRMVGIASVLVVAAGICLIGSAQMAAQPHKPPDPPCWPPPCGGDELCKWTAWVNRDLPSGQGDYETRADLIKEGQIKCKQPLAAQCRYRGGVLWGSQIASYQASSSAGPGYRCETIAGGWCVNSQTVPKNTCKDSEVRFCCLPE